MLKNESKDFTMFDKFLDRFFYCYQKVLIDSRNKKLLYFHLIVSATIFFDFYLTGLIMANYKFMIGVQHDYISHETKYFYICLI